jgi:hypothetical protein
VGVVLRLGDVHDREALVVVAHILEPVVELAAGGAGRGQGGRQRGNQ